MKTRHRKMELVKGEALVVGVDIGKMEHVAALRVSGAVIEKMRFRNDGSGFRKLAEKVKECSERLGLKRVVLGMEPTGQYGEPLRYWWDKNQGAVVLVSPVHTQRAKELEDNSPLKNDSKDAEVVSWLVAEGKYFVSHVPRGEYATLRELVRERVRYVDEEVRLVNQLQQSVDRIFPEIARAFSSFRVKSFRKLLAKYADPEVVSKMTPEVLGKKLKKWSGGKLGRERAEKIIGMARESVGVSEGKEAIQAGIQRLIQRLEASITERELVEEQIKRHLRKVPGASLLLTVPDFGEVTVASLLAETGDLSEYEHPDQVIKLAGLNLYEISSGKHRGRVRITKRGRGQFRQILYMAALRATRRRGMMRSYYARLIARGKPATSALVAVMRKLLRVSWAVVTKAKPYDPALTNPELARAA